MESPVPPCEEQVKLVEEIERMMFKLDSFKATKQLMISLLQEQKYSIIDKYILGGIVKQPLKKSNTKWLGNIPETWKVKRLKYIVEINPSKNLLEDSKKEMVVFLPMENISVIGQIDNSIKVIAEEVWTGYTYFNRNDVVVAKITPCFENGKGAWLNNLETKFGFGTTELYVLRANEEEIYPEFLYWVTQSRIFRKNGEAFMYGTAGQQRVPADYLKNFETPIPILDEQVLIIKKIKLEIKKIDQVISKLQREIGLISEYRTTLIQEVIFGNIDIAAQKVEKFPNGMEER